MDIIDNNDNEHKDVFSIYEQMILLDKIKNGNLDMIDFNQIFNIIKDNNIQYTKESKGILIAMSDIPFPVMKQIKDFVDSIKKEDSVSFYDKASNRIAKLFDCEKVNIKDINNNTLEIGSYSDSDYLNDYDDLED